MGRSMGRSGDARPALGADDGWRGMEPPPPLVRLLGVGGDGAVSGSSSGRKGGDADAHVPMHFEVVYTC
jgi:hypothetical protein